MLLRQQSMKFLFLVRCCEKKIELIKLVTNIRSEMNETLFEQVHKLNLCHTHMLLLIFWCSFKIMFHFLYRAKTVMFDPRLKFF